MKKVILRRVREEKKFFEKKQEKVFTKKKVNSTIKKDYNPFEVNYKIYQRRDGLYNMQDVVLEKNKKELNIKELIDERMMKNANLFSEGELTIIKSNGALIEKVYILGMLDNL